MREQIAPGRFSSPKKRPGPEAKGSQTGPPARARARDIARCVYGGGEQRG